MTKKDLIKTLEARLLRFENSKNMDAYLNGRYDELKQVLTIIKKEEK